MPELPEVETVRRVLAPLVTGAVFKRVEIFYKPLVETDDDTFLATLPGKKILRLSRHGKFLVFHLSEGWVLISHLRMEGRYQMVAPHEALPRFTRAVFSFVDGRRLAYADSRCFGKFRLTREATYLQEPPLSRLGPEPMRLSDPEAVYHKIHARKRAIKEVMLDQSVLSGLGNIYVDETLFRSHIHPETPAHKLTHEAVMSLLEQAAIVLQGAVAAGGSTVRTYHAPQGIDGRFQNELLAYGKKGEPCPVCGTPFKKIFVGGRGTTFCPHCQKNPALPLRVAITGKIASGKSTVLRRFHDAGFKTLSADEVVHDLYREPATVTKLAHVFGDDIIRNHRVDRVKLGALVRENPTLRKRLEKIVHPQVGHVIDAFIKASKKRYVAVEVPLLYEAHMEDDFDVVVAVGASLEKQIEHLRSRGVSEVEKALALNRANTFDDYVKKADFVVMNDGSLHDLETQIDAVIESIKKR